MDIFHFDPQVMFSFMLTLMRISLVLFLLPFFGGKSVPSPVKAALLLVFTLAVFPQLGFAGRQMPADIWAIFLVLLGEVALGLIMGLLVRFLFASAQFAGGIMGFQMGFTMVNAVDPLTGQQEPVTSHFLYMVTLLTFLSMNGHLYLLSGLAKSFELVPPGGVVLESGIANQVIELSSEMFILAVKISAPVTVAVIMVDVALAIISRVAPQMHLLVFGFPLKIMVGFFFLALMFKYLSRFVGEFLAGLDTSFQVLLKLAGG
ncbi:flagellar biosynthetic protein FliR [Desulfohalovibrio reitneri]|uniref:flagellar biosynthetic protein FliR n=1 Tax=Desulfohalovibrio reitneri TaxID=1307759 RepID=UPI0004A77083|nr:flagellar biosynthetic protein FliR [Desulfohalovibrio reitneri]